MAAIAARLTVIGENGYGEPEQDANSALTELDKGLRSSKIGEQTEAIVRFPRLFEKYPFPILINSAFLKLADVFRIGNNFLRLCILKVSQQSEKHLDKILNVDEFVRRIFSVIHSNDPFARALTLRTLGSIACIIPEQKNVHHSIRICLDSNDAVELEAAIFASAKFAAQSQTFASNICSKVGQMIEGLATPVDMKLKLISVFQHMHHDAQTAAMVRSLCIELLPAYPAQEFVMVTLNTLTQLAAASLVDVENQVQLLVQYLQTDARHSVQLLALQNLKELAKKGAHFWTNEQVENVLKFTHDTPYSILKCGGLEVLSTLARSVAVTKFSISVGSVFHQLYTNCCFHGNLVISSKAVELLTHIAVHIFQEDQIIEGLDLFQDALLAIESLLLAASCSDDKTIIKALKLCLNCAVTLCDANSDACHKFVDSIGTLISTTTGINTILLCEALSGMGNRKAGVNFMLLPDFLQRLNEIASISYRGSLQTKTMAVLCTLIFQTLYNHVSDPNVQIAVQKAIKRTDLWICYRIARQAARYGHHQIAAEIFSHLTNRVCSEHLHFWLSALLEFSLGESCLQSATSSSHIDIVSNAVTQYMKGISALKAATTPSNSMQFQCEYVRLRAETLQCHAQLTRTCTSLKTSPPPAVAAAIAMATRDELQRCGRITMQLRKCVREFRCLGDQYGRLYQSVFDADPITLIHLQVLQQNCFLVAHAIENIALKVQNFGMCIGDDEPPQDLSLGSLKHQTQHTVETLGMLLASQEAMAVITAFAQQETQKLIGHQHVDHLLKVSQILTRAPLCYPRYFFQSLQSTSIKLAISPQPRAPGEPINIQNNSHLALKVEGVIQHSGRPGLFRQIKSVSITVSSTLQSRSQLIGDMKAIGDTTNNMTQIVEPHHDYFNAQFLLAFPVAGLHAITVEVSVVDKSDDVWKTGPRSSLTIKSFDDSVNPKSQASTSRSAFTQRF